MSNEYVLKKNFLDHFDQLYDLYMQPNVNRFLNFEIMPKESFKEIFDELTRCGNLYTYEYESRVIATTIVVRQKRRVCHVATLTTVATHPAFQNQGIGSRFMREIMEVLREEGIKRVDLHTEGDNPVAINFYKKLGFQHEGTMKNLFKRADEEAYVDQYIMALMLDKNLDDN